MSLVMSSITQYTRHEDDAVYDLLPASQSVPSANLYTSLCTQDTLTYSASNADARYDVYANSHHGKASPGIYL